MNVKICKTKTINVTRRNCGKGSGVVLWLNNQPDHRFFPLNSSLKTHLGTMWVSGTSCPLCADQEARLKLSTVAHTHFPSRRLQVPHIRVTLRAFPP